MDRKKEKLVWQIVFVIIIGIGAFWFKKTQAAEPVCFVEHIAVMQRAMNIPEDDAWKFLKEVTGRIYTLNDGEKGESLRRQMKTWIKSAYALSVDDAGIAINKSRWDACNVMLAEKKIPGLAMPTNFVSKVVPALAKNEGEKKK